MLKSLFGKSLVHAPLAEAESGRTDDGRANLDRLMTLVRFFPIGRKLRYCPEYKTAVVFDTFVVAHRLNGNFVYSGNSICQDAQGNSTTFISGPNDEQAPVVGLKQFQLLIPDTSYLERKLDYPRRALIGRERQFRVGNCISLVSNGGSLGMATIDTEVAQQIVLRDGPYARTKMIVLAPDLNTLAVTDQRRNVRAKTRTPAAVTLLKGTVLWPCSIVDMSEGGLLIRLSGKTTMPALSRGSIAVLDFDLGEPKRHYTIRGSVIRPSAETCVIQMDGPFGHEIDGSAVSLELLELKAGLLNYPS